MDCSICGFTVANARGLASHFRHQSDTHPDYKEWLEEQKWKDKTEGVDFVRCLECGVRSGRLVSHLPKHGMSVQQYREKWGESAPIHAAQVERRRKARSVANNRDRTGTKQVPCTTCGVEITVHKYAGSLHDLRCSTCKTASEEARWEGKTEPEDFVTCLDCGHRAENLTSHVTNAHSDYRDRHPDAVIVALCSAVRDKEALRGRTLSSEVRAKMSANAGRWNKGLTKETHPSLRSASEKMRGRVPWSKGLTAMTDERLQQTVAKLKLYVGENRPWSNGLKADLTLEDFQPFLDDEGCVDRRAIVEATGLSWRTIFTYMQSLDLETSDKYVRERSENQIIRLDREVLEQWALGNGKISVARVMRDTGHSFSVVKRECARHGLETFTRNGEQTLVLDAISEALGGKPYQMEWKDWRFVNPATGWRFKFDGYFPDVGLVVEYHGHQHYIFPNAWHYKPEHTEAWHAMLERDRIKKEMIEASSDLTYLEVRFDDPLTSVDFYRGLLRRR
jgi:predicted transcriptional regulator